MSREKFEINGEVKTEGFQRKAFESLSGSNKISINLGLGGGLGFYIFPT